jgi:hypothetical protein
MPRRIYVGACVEIVTRLDDVEMVLSRGQSVDVSEETAKLLDRDTTNWAAPRQPQTNKDGDS